VPVGWGHPVASVATAAGGLATAGPAGTGVRVRTVGTVVPVDGCRATAVLVDTVATPQPESTAVPPGRAAMGATRAYLGTAVLADGAGPGCLETTVSIRRLPVRPLPARMPQLRPLLTLPSAMPGGRVLTGARVRAVAPVARAGAPSLAPAPPRAPQSR
jgi:hypothetical protein